MGLYNTLTGLIRIKKDAFEKLLTCSLNDEEDVRSLLCYSSKTIEYDKQECCFEFQISTKRGYLFEGFYKAIAYYKDIDFMDKITFISEATRWEYVEEIHIKPGLYRFFDVKRNKVVFNLRKEQGWEEVNCLAKKLALNSNEGSFTVFGKKGEVHVFEPQQLEWELLAIFNDEDFGNYELMDAGGTIRWPKILPDMYFNLNDWINWTHR